MSSLTLRLNRLDGLETHLNELNRKMVVKDEEIKKTLMMNLQLTSSIQSLEEALDSEQKYTESKA